MSSPVRIGVVVPVLDLLHQLAELPGHHVFHPREIVFLHRARQLDAAVDADVPVVIGRERNLRTDHAAHLADPVVEPRDALVGDLDAGERMHHRLAGTIAVADRHRQRAGHVLQQVDTEVLLQKRDPQIHPRLQLLALVDRTGRFRRVGIEPHRVAEPAAEHLKRRHAVGLPREIPHRHLDAAYAARLTRVMSELLDLAEHLVDVARILAEDARFEHQRIRFRRAVAHLAVARDPLIRVDPDQRTGHRRLHDDRDTQIRDLQLRRLRGRLHVLRDRLERVVSDKAGGRADTKRRGSNRFREVAAIELSFHRSLHGGSSTRNKASGQLGAPLGAYTAGTTDVNTYA